jgi:integration host factor beta subunit
MLPTTAGCGIRTLTAAGGELATRQSDASGEGVSAVTKADLVEEIATRTGLTKKDIGHAVDGFIEAIKSALAEGQHIEIRGFGTFSVKDRKARTARNPRTGEAVPLPPRRVPVFKVSRELKDRVLGKEQ